MRVPWVSLAFGAACTAGGLWLAARGWSSLGGTEPTAAGLASLGAGVLLALLGALLLLVPLVVPLLYRLHGDAAFTTRASACPVVAKCGRCGTFNFRGRAACKDCGVGLVWQAQPAEA